MLSSRISSKGQVTIPAEIRKKLGAEEGDQLIFSVTGDGKAEIMLIKNKPLESLFGSLPAKNEMDDIDLDEIRARGYRSMSKKRYEEGNDMN